MFLSLFLYTMTASPREKFPILLRCHILSVPHGRDPFLALSQRAAGMLSQTVIHGLAFLRAVEHVPEEQHLPRPGDDLEAGPCEDGVPSLLGDLAIRKARRQT